jgi:hypothetical protein
MRKGIREAPGQVGVQWIRVDMTVAQRLLWSMFPNVRLAEASATHLGKKTAGHCVFQTYSHS